MAGDLDIVCDICQIKMHFGRRKNKKYQDKIFQFIQDHHVCDPDKGVRILNLDKATKYSFYTDVEGDTEKDYSS